MILYRWHHADISVSDAAAAAVSVGAAATPALVYSPDSVFFCVVDAAGQWQSADPNVDAQTRDSAYELRLFSEEGELRWLKDPSQPGAIGSAVFISEGQGPSGWTKRSQLEVERQRTHHYLLWGKVKSFGEVGWRKLVDSRIGSLYVPCEAADGQRVQLLAVEYMGLADGEAGIEHGNKVIVEERLLGLEAVQSKTTNKGKPHV